MQFVLKALFLNFNSPLWLSGYSDGHDGDIIKLAKDSSFNINNQKVMLLLQFLNL